MSYIPFTLLDLPSLDFWSSFSLLLFGSIDVSFIWSFLWNFLHILFYIFHIQTLAIYSGNTIARFTMVTLDHRVCWFYTLYLCEPHHSHLSFFTKFSSEKCEKINIQMP